VQILRQRRRKTITTAPTILSAIQAASQSTFINDNYAPLVISWHEKNRQPTFLNQGKLALTTKNTRYAL
jgi:hypothetical protein